MATSMNVMTTVPINPAIGSAKPRPIVERPGLGDRLFRRGAGLSGASVLVIMVAVGLFLGVKAWPAFQARGLSFLTTSAWQPDTGIFGIAAVVGFTISISFVAVAVAVPISVGSALFITELAPPRVRSWLIAMIDLMAAVPSVVYGLWGRELFQGQAVFVARWLDAYLGWIPFFDVTGTDPRDPLSGLSPYTASTFITGLVVAMMVVPIQCSVMREVFSQVPLGEREGAFALGATRWGMVRIVTLPFGRGGIIGGTMLGLGRALGETMAVVMIISPSFDFTYQMLGAGTNSVSALIALRFNESSDFGLSALMAAGLTLFSVTLVVNFFASTVVARSRSGAMSEA